LNNLTDEGVLYVCVLTTVLTTVLQRLEMLACACAAGVAAAFGSAFGATLFSLEASCTADTIETVLSVAAVSPLVLMLLAYVCSDTFHLALVVI
jgi:H+/Cl- antiporter ClcA